MAERTSIEWTEKTFNPWRGCSRVSKGCTNCYAEAGSRRNPAVLGVWGPEGTRVVAAEDQWGRLYAWNRQAERDGRRLLVFAGSWCDVFEDWQGPLLTHRGVPLWVAPDGRWRPEDHGVPTDGPSWRPLTLRDVRARLWQAVERTPWLVYQLVTKRPENTELFTPPAWLPQWPANVWLLASVEDQAVAGPRLEALLGVRARVRGLSCEPLLGPLRLDAPAGLKAPRCGEDVGLWDCRRCGGTGYFQCDPYAVGCSACGGHGGPGGRRGTGRGVDWVIVGGESGPRARPCHLDWLRGLVRQCRDGGVPVFVKQLGDHVEASDIIDAADYFPGDVRLAPGELAHSARVHLGGRKGGDVGAWPPDLRIREWPRGYGPERQP